MAEADFENPEVDAAAEALSEAAANYMRVLFGDDSIITVGLLMQASGSGAIAGETLASFRKGNKVERMGLLAFLNYNTEEDAFGGNES